MPWRRYLHSSNKIWDKLIGDQVDDARRLVSEYRTGVSGVGRGWLLDHSSVFFINNLEFACKDFAFIKGWKNRRVAARSLTKKIESCEILRSTEFDPVRAFKLLKVAEAAVESQRHETSFIDSELEDFISSVTMECGFSVETILQTRRIVELSLGHKKISKLFNPMKIVIVGAAIACELEEGDMPTSLVEDYFYGEAEDSDRSQEDVDDRSDFESAKALVQSSLLHLWYHPVPSLFIRLLMKIHQILNPAENAFNKVFMQKNEKAKSKAYWTLVEGSMLPPSQIAEESFYAEHKVTISFR